MARKDAGLKETRRAGLDLCDAIVADLCSRGLLSVTRDVLHRLEDGERSLKSFKLMRFSREMAALRTRFNDGLRRGDLTASVMAERLSRLHSASVCLRRLLEDPCADPVEIEDLAGRTWREADLDRRENVLLAELAWESVTIEEGFRIDSSYFLAPGGEVWCDRKIIPTGLRAAIDDSPKPQYPDPAVYPAVGLYPGDLPRRVKLLEKQVLTTSGAGRAPHSDIRALLSGAASSLDDLIHRYLARKRRPFPPETLPVILVEPRVRFNLGEWWVVDREMTAIRVTSPPGASRYPSGAQCIESFERAALSCPLDALLILLFDDSESILAAPIGAVTPEQVLRFGL